MRHLFVAWESASARICRARHIALLLDFDGTLAELRPRPGQVRLRAAVRRAIARLARRRDMTVAIISGRPLHDLRARARVPRVICLGLHGWERKDRKSAPSKRLLRELEQLKVAERAELRGLRRIWVEDKNFGFAVHFRGASAAITRRAESVFRNVLRPMTRDFRVLAGKKVWEVLPRSIQGKGSAVKSLLRELRKPALAIYVGDDTSDESAFAALPRGITVRVGRSRRTKARFWVRNPKEVLEFLERLGDIAGLSV